MHKPAPDQWNPHICWIEVDEREQRKRCNISRKINQEKSYQNEHGELNVQTNKLYHVKVHEHYNSHF